VSAPIRLRLAQLGQGREDEITLCTMSAPGAFRTFAKEIKSTELEAERTCQAPHMKVPSESTRRGLSIDIGEAHIAA
jgi:hypothetical protein